MITLVSYPRSGNTFLRNVLFECYGISSKTYHLEAHGPDQGWSTAPVVKTHLLPNQLPDALRQRTIVYLIRDGRDAAVSLAHHRKDIIDPTSSFDANLEAVTYAAEGSHFGGWSAHVEAWIPKADVVLRFEEFVLDPIASIERLRPFLELHESDEVALPSFSDLKLGRPEYGSGKHLEGMNLAQHWFRSGQSNGWKDEMSDQQQHLFWHLHGETMEYAGYTLSGNAIGRLPEINLDQRVLIEANKLQESFVDGIGRYVRSILETVSRFPVAQTDVWMDGKFYSLESARAFEPTSPKSFVFEFSKRVFKLLAPNLLYNALARRYHDRLLRRSSHADTTVTTKAHLYDALLISLPQHVLDVDLNIARKTFCVVHDLTHHSHPAFHEESNIDRALKGLDMLRKQKTKLIAVSKATQNQLSKLGLHAHLTYEGVDRRRFYPIQNAHLLNMVKERYALPEKPFLLTVSTLEPRKNTLKLIEAYAAVPKEVQESYHLVLAGRKGWKWNDLSIPKSLERHVHFTGFIREEHLAALYTLSSGFCYISEFEGFGLPVLEAMACGKPVLVSDRGALPEVAGAEGIFCDPDQPESIVKGIHRLIDQSNDNQTSERVMQHTWNFTWRDAWLKTADLLLEKSRA